MIEANRLRHLAISITATNKLAAEIYGRMVSGEALPPDVDIEPILRHVEMLGREIPGGAAVTLFALHHLARLVWRKIVALRAECEERGEMMAFCPQALAAIFALGALAVRVALRNSCVSLTHLRPILRFLHQ